MLTVRYPNGQAVQYNNASKLTYKPGIGWELTDSRGGWVATVQESAGAIVECVTPCRVYDAPERKVDSEIREVKKALVSVRRAISKKKSK